MAVTLRGCHSRGALARGSAFQSHLLCSVTSCMTLQGEGFLKSDSGSLMGAPQDDEHTAASCLIFAE